MCIVAAVLRLSTWPQVFTAAGVRFVGDDDTYYHVLRAQRIAQDFPRVPWEDPSINYPEGAAILWPPLFDHMIATAAFALAGGAPPLETTERVGAAVPVLLGLATLPLVAALGRRLCGPTAGLAVAFFVALLPAHAEMSVLGRPDQHVMEVLLCCAVLLAFLRGWHGNRARPWQVACLGLAITLSFWNWMGSALTLSFLALFVALWHIVGSPEDRAVIRVPRCLAQGAAAGAVLLAASVLALGAPDALASTKLIGVGGLHVILVLLTSAFAAVLWMASRRIGAGRVRRTAEVVAAAIVPGVCAAILLPALSEGVAHGLTALTRGNPWYRNIQEFDPLLCAGFEPLSTELRGALRLFGLLPLFMPLAVPAMRRAWRDRPADRPAVLFLALWGAVFIVLALARVRFAIYFAIPLSLWSWLALTELSASLAFWLRREKLQPVVFWLAAGLALAPAMMEVLERPLAETSEAHEELVRALQWLREQPPVHPERPAVLAEWAYGHLVRYVADKPVLVNPFGSDLGPEGMRDSAAFFLATDPRSARAVLERRRIGFVVLANPLTEAHFAQGFAPPETPRAVEVQSHCLTGVTAEPADAFWKLIPARLYFFDGAADPVLDGYRLLYESDTRAVWKDTSAARFKIFDVVPGVRVTIRGKPGGTIEISTRLRTRLARVFEWRRRIGLDLSGASVVRLPYATGVNGTVTAEDYRVTDGVRDLKLSFTAEQIERGHEQEVDLHDQGVAREP